MLRRWILKTRLSRVSYSASNLVHYTSNPNHVNDAKSGKTNFENDFNLTHLETSPLQKVLLGLGSGLISIADPSRGDMIAVMGETTGNFSLNYVKMKMLQSEEGRIILEEKPRINSGTVSLKKLKSMPEGTLGKEYSNFLEKHKFTPDTRMAVRFVDDLELAYVIQRYREVHDLFHTLLNMPTNMLGEVTVKWVEAIQTKLPMCVGGAILGPLRLAPKLTRSYSTAINPTQDEKRTYNYDIIDIPEQCLLKVPCVKLPERICESIKNVLSEQDTSRKSFKIMEGKIPNFIKKRNVSFHLSETDLEIMKQNIIDEHWKKFQLKGGVNLDKQEFEKYNEKDIKGSIKSKIYAAKALDFDKEMCYAYLRSRAPAEYAVLYKIFNEIKVRDPNFKPRYLFDFGSGVGTVMWAAHYFWRNSLKEYFCVDPCKEMNNLAELIVYNNDLDGNPFLQKLYQRQFMSSLEKDFDIVISSYTLLELRSAESRAEALLNLWNKTSNYLVIVEPGTLAGFHLINEARDHMHSICVKNEIRYHIFSPCPHTASCPRFYEKTLKHTPCNFRVQYFPYDESNIYPEAKTEEYSYVIFKRGKPEADHSKFSRIVREVLKPGGQAIVRHCTPSGTLQETIFTKGYGKLLYRGVKLKLNWGDLLPFDWTLKKKKKTEDDKKTEQSS